MNRHYLALSIPALTACAALYACVINSPPPATGQNTSGGTTTATATDTSTGTASASATATATATGTASGTATTGDTTDAAAPVSSGTPAGPTDDAGAAGSDMTACASDSDCITVARNGCCNNGWKEAVASSKQAAYKASFKCDQPHPMCPMYMVNDQRVAECSNSTQHCEMVKPEEVHCGGNIRNAHKCPDGFTCQMPPSHADSGGTCVAKQ